MSHPPPVMKLVNRTWKKLPDEGEDVFIRDPKLKEGYVGDLTKRSVQELREVMARQDKILNNGFLSSKLKDKGKKLRERREAVAKALENAIQQSNESRRDIPADINAMEWKSRRKTESKQEQLDSDDDEDESRDSLDPLKLMAYHYSCVKRPHAQNGGRSLREEEDATDAIAKELLALELQDARQEEKEEEGEASCEFGDKRNRMLEEMRKRNGPVRDSFKPFRPLPNPQPIPGLTHHAVRSVATTTVCIPQQEALKLERDFLVKEKERVLSETRKQLGRSRAKIGLPPASSTVKYRDTNIDKHFLESEDEEEDDVSDSYDFYDD